MVIKMGITKNFGIIVSIERKELENFGTIYHYDIYYAPAKHGIISEGNMFLRKEELRQQLKELINEWIEYIISEMEGDNNDQGNG